MPGYRQHDTVALIAAPVLTFAVTQVTTVSNALAIGAAFLLVNRYLSPDLDIDSIMNRRWGMLYFIWYPYKKFFHHRSFWTHSGPVSATIRFMYLAAWLSPVLLFVHPPWLIIAGLYLLMVLVDIVHTLLDWIV